jgi:hypothetical protein
MRLAPSLPAAEQKIFPGSSTDSAGIKGEINRLSAYATEIVGREVG